MSLANDLLREAHRARVWGSPVTLSAEEADRIAQAVKLGERLLTYAAHKRGCLSTLPCSCGLDDLLREARS